MKFIKVQNKKTGEQFTACYATNRLGNMQYWIYGKFYNDKSFDREFKIIN